MLTIHGAPISVHTRKVILAAVIKDLEFRVEPVIPFDPPPGWSELSPTGLIPVIEDHGFVLADSTAICLYLERRVAAPALLPSDPRALGYALWLDAYAGGTLFRQLVQPLFFQRVVRPKLLGETTDEGLVGRLLTEVRPRVLGYLESQATEPRLDPAFLSLGELAVASNLINLAYLGCPPRPDEHPALARWLAAAVDQAPFSRVIADERPFAERMGLRLA